MAPSEQKARIVEITPQLAAEWLKKNKHNRPLKPSIVKQHVATIEANEFLLTNDAITFDTRGALTNGQHRLSACVITGKTIECLVLNGASPKAFAVMDTGKIRTGADVLAIDKSDNPGEMAVALRLLVGRLEGKGIKSGKVNNLHLMQLLQDHPEVNDSVDFIVKLNAAKDGFLKQLGNLGIFACLHYLMRESGIDKAKSLAKEFWEIVADLEIEGKESGPVRLRMKLMADKKSASPLSRNSKIGIIVKAFLAFADDEKVQTLAIQKGEYPVLGGLDIDPEEVEPEPTEEPSGEPEAEKASPKPKKKKRKKKVVQEEPTPLLPDDGPPPESE